MPGGSTRHERWDAKATGGVIAVYDAEGQLFKTIEIAPDVFGEDGYVLAFNLNHPKICCPFVARFTCNRLHFLAFNEGTPKEEKRPDPLL